MIKITEADRGDTIYLSVSHIIYFAWLEDKSRVRIEMINNHVLVKETPEEILALIKESKNG